MATAIFFTFIIIALCADSYNTQEINVLKDFDGTEININNQDDHLDGFSTRRQNNKTVGPPPVEPLCYVGHMKCEAKSSIKNVTGSLICAYHKSHGLVNFQNPCEIALQNCLYKVQQRKSGQNADDIFYYNGKAKPCEFYLKTGKTIKKAVQLYYIDQVNFAKYLGEFEKIDNNNKYDFIDLVYA